MDTQIIIETRDLTKKYNQHTVVDHLNLHIEEGEIFGFLGPNGAGKSTTLLMFLGLTRPSGGSVLVCGLDPGREAKEVKKFVGYIPENVGFYNDMDALENLRYVADLNNLDKGEAMDRINDALKIVGLQEDAYTRKAGTFSRGMRQRLGIAEVLIKNPKVMFLDEPTSGLDPDGALRLIEVIRSLNRERDITVLISSHNLHHVQKLSSRVGIMIDGKMVADGSIEALAREKFGLGEEKFTLDEIYMKYFQEV